MKVFSSTLLQEAKHETGSSNTGVFQSLQGSMNSALSSGANSGVGFSSSELGDVSAQFKRNLNYDTKNYLSREDVMNFAEFNTDYVKSKYAKSISSHATPSHAMPQYENMNKFDSTVLSAINTYRWHFGKSLKVNVTTGKTTDNSKITTDMIDMGTSLSLFNPYHHVNVKGLVEDVPLLNDIGGIGDFNMGIATHNQWFVVPDSTNITQKAAAEATFDMAYTTTIHETKTVTEDGKEKQIQVPKEVASTAVGYDNNVFLEDVGNQLSAPTKSSNIQFPTTYKTDDNGQFVIQNGQKVIETQGTLKPDPFAPALEIDKNISPARIRLSIDDYNLDKGDCSISTLVYNSKVGNNGAGSYRYVDFMFCRDLGKVPNNRLLTLRKFSSPIGDNITKSKAGKKNRKGVYSTYGGGDIGRLVTWFGTPENKLEDIMKYDMKATWKWLDSKIDAIPSQEDSGASGPLGAVVNTFSPAYNKSMLAGIAGQHSLIGKWVGAGMSRLGSIVGAGNMMGAQAPYAHNPALGMHDKNKIYTPKDTIQGTHLYEGKLEFNQEMTITFAYKLRAYDNINPKAAFLDLLGNILTVCYRKGHFWGGSRMFIGAPGNRRGWSKANAMVDKGFDKLWSFGSNLLTGNFDLNSIIGSIANAFNSLVNKAKEIFANPSAAWKKVTDKGSEIMKKYKIKEGIKGAVKNSLGRPAMYAMDSLLSGDAVGLWHLTVGNPRNPIASFGNLIMEKAEVQHSGPLGIDDFPTDLIVKVTLKHGRPRDATEIQRMYTQGISAIYNTPSLRTIDEYFNINGWSTDPEYIKLKQAENDWETVSRETNNLYIKEIEKNKGKIPENEAEALEKLRINAFNNLKGAQGGHTFEGNYNSLNDLSTILEGSEATMDAILDKAYQGNNSMRYNIQALFGTDDVEIIQHNMYSLGQQTGERQEAKDISGLQKEPEKTED